MTTRRRKLKPWTKVATPHVDIRSGALEMATYAADLGAVHRRDLAVPEVYRDPRRFFEQTYLTEELGRLLADALGVLAGRPGDQILQLRTPFGGGKTHTLLALLHLATGRSQLVGIPEIDELPDPGAVRVAVLSGIDLDPLSPRRHGDTEARTLWGELSLQLGGQEAYAHVAEQDQRRVAPGRDALSRVFGDGPVLLLLDETMQYVTRSRGIPVGDGTLHQQVMSFIQILTETVRNRPGTAMVYSLQQSVAEAAEDEAGLAALDHLVGRMDAKRTPVSGDDVMRVVQRRLFANLGDEVERDQVIDEYGRLHEQIATATATSDDERREAAEEARILEERIRRSYPFHPLLLDCMYHRWGSLPSYQRTRGALQFLACVVHALFTSPREERVQPLIGPGDVPLDDEQTRGAFFSQVGTRQFDGPVAADIVGESARAGEVDRRIGQDAPDLGALAVGTRLATAALLHSFGGPQGPERGVLEPELIKAVAAPGLDHGIAQRALSELRVELLYLHSVGRLYRFEAEPNLNKLIADGAQAWTPAEVVARLRDELERRLGNGADRIVWPSDGSRVPDHEPRFAVVYMDPESAQWRAAEHVPRHLTEWLERKPGGVAREFRNALGFALMDPGALNRALPAARTLMALEDMRDSAGRFQLSPEQREEVKDRLGAARAEIDRALDALYDRVALPAPDETGEHGYRWVVEHTEGRMLSGRNIHERLLDLLSPRVFDSVTGAKLATLVRLGDGDEQIRAYPLGRLVRDAFSFIQFPRLRDESVLRRGVSRGIAEGVFGYVPIGEIHGETLSADRPDLIRLGQEVPPGELLLEDTAFICTPTVALSLQPSRVTPRRILEVVRLDENAGRVPIASVDRGALGDPAVGPPTASAIAEALGAGAADERFGLVSDAREEDGRLVRGPSTKVSFGAVREHGDAGLAELIVSPEIAVRLLPPEPPRDGRSLVIRSRLDVKQLMRIVPGVANLADQSEACEIEVTIRSRAKDAAGYAPAFLENAVAEHFLEADVPWEPTLGE